jgi:hypothetical protein
MEMGSENPSDTAEKVRGKVRLQSLDDLDGRTLAAKKASALVAALESDAGGSDNISTGQRQLIRHAALLGAYLEDQEVKWLQREDIDLTALVSVINAQRRLLATLGLERKPREVNSETEEYRRILGYMQEAEAAP